MLSSIQLASQSLPPAIVDAAPADKRAGETLAESGDTFERSAFSSMFGQLGLDPSSRLEATRERVNFNFSFTSSTKETLNATGYVAERDQRASMTLTYTFQRVVAVDGKREIKTFDAALSFEADTSQSLSVKPFREKEDIMQFLHRLLDDVMDLIRDDSVVLNGVTLDQGDLAEIMNLDKGGVKRLFDQLVSAIMRMAMLKRLHRGAAAGPNVVLNETRRTVDGLTVEKDTESQFSFSISIRESGASDAQQPAAARPPALTYEPSQPAATAQAQSA